MWRLDDDEQDESNERPDGLTTKLLKTRTIIVAEGISDKTYRKVAGTLALLEAMDPDKGITVFVNSPGGSADSGFTAAIGAPTLCGVGPIGAKAHSPDEVCHLDSLIPRAKAVALAILRLP